MPREEETRVLDGELRPLVAQLEARRDPNISFLGELRSWESKERLPAFCPASGLMPAPPLPLLLLCEKGPKARGPFVTVQSLRKQQPEPLKGAEGTLGHTQPSQFK